MTVQASPRWAVLRPFDIYAKDGSGDVYLHRIRLIQTPWFAVYLHDLNLPDSDRFPHDHPWAFCSIVLRGGYTEVVYQPVFGCVRQVDGRMAQRTVRRHSRWSAHRMGTDVAHEITQVQPRTKTLVLCGPRSRNWGFWTDNGFVPWQEYVDAGDQR